MLTAHLRIDGFDFRLRLRGRGSRRQASHDPETPIGTRFHLIISEREWLPNFRAATETAAVSEIKKLKRKIEACGHHAHHCEISAVQEELRPDDLWIAIKTTLPQ